MKIVLISLIVFLIGGFLGANSSKIQSFVSVHTDSTGVENAIEGENDSSGKTSEKKPLYWVAPMDKNYRRDQPGLSPMGMDLVPVYAEEDAGDEGAVRISATVENNLGVKTASVSKGRLFQPIQTVGTVQFDESNLHHIHSRVEGWIDVLNISAVGDRVKKGQTLFELYSPELVNAQEEYLAALRSGNKNLMSASKARLMSLGVEETQIELLQQKRKVDQRIKVIAAVDGVVTKMMVRQGMFIKPMTEILSMGSLDKVWVIGEVFERQSYLVKQGQSVEVQFNAFPDRVWEGKVDYLYPELDATTRTLQLRISIDNPNKELKPNMFANLSIKSYSQAETLNVPVQALIKTRRYQRVVKSLGDGQFKSVIVKSGLRGIDEPTGMQMVQILDGLSENDKVVTSAQFLIDSESNIDAELARMEATIEHTEMNLQSVMGMGIINNVMSGHNMLNITHDPITEWDWPKMTMNFDVDPSISLIELSQGEEICFTILKQENGSILITELTSLKKSGELNRGDSK